MIHKAPSFFPYSILLLCLTAALFNVSLGFAPLKLPVHRRSLFQYDTRYTNSKLYAGSQNEDSKSNVSLFDQLLKSFGISQPSGNSVKTKQKTSLKSGKAVRKLPKKKVIIIGSGMSGLASAKELMQSGCSDFIIVDSADGPGGRVRTDNVDGYLLDRGFQVFIDSYPEAKSLFDNDFSDLNLKSFLPGALVHYE
jgi:Flavin containing amine oxidoreductase